MLQDRYDAAWVRRELFRRAMAWDERERIKRLLAGMLARAGWRLYGYIPHHREGERRYVPASWVGVATRDRALIAIGVSEAYAQCYSGLAVRRKVWRDAGPCGTCEGSGVAPSREEALTAEMQEAIDRVSALGALTDGAPGCRRCVGTGRAGEYVSPPDAVERWPTFHANPPRTSWHTEVDGEIVAHGVGLWSSFAPTDAPPVTRIVYRDLEQALVRMTASFAELDEGLVYRPHDVDQALVEAVRAGDPGEMRYWLDAGADPRAVTPSDLNACPEQADVLAAAMARSEIEWAAFDEAVACRRLLLGDAATSVEPVTREGGGAQ